MAIFVEIGIFNKIMAIFVVAQGCLGENSLFNLIMAVSKMDFKPHHGHLCRDAWGE